MSIPAAEWATKTTGIAMKLSNNPEDAAKFSNYMAKLSEDIKAAMSVK